MKTPITLITLITMITPITLITIITLITPDNPDPNKPDITDDPNNDLLRVAKSAGNSSTQSQGTPSKSDHTRIAEILELIGVCKKDDC
jgi:hypothetical protein